MRMTCKQCDCNLWSQYSRESEICPECKNPDADEFKTLEERLQEVLE